MPVGGDTKAYFYPHWTPSTPGTGEGQTHPWPTSVPYPRDGPLVSPVGCIQGGVRTKSEHVRVRAGSPSGVTQVNWCQHPSPSKGHNKQLLASVLVYSSPTSQAPSKVTIKKKIQVLNYSNNSSLPRLGLGGAGATSHSVQRRCAVTAQADTGREGGKGSS